jgi:glycosyltransferase involved in cell wall biosynthesis
MKILYILQEFPFPPDNGIRWKIYNLLNYMETKHECHIISFGVSNELERAKDWCSSLPGLKVLDIFPQPFNLKQRINQVWEIIKGNPPSLGRWKSQEFVNAICRAFKENSYDVVHLDMINMAQYWSFLQNIPTVLSVNDAISMRYWRVANTTNNILKKIALTFSAKRIDTFEFKIYPKFTSIHVVSEIDAGYLLSKNLNLKIKVIKLSVDPKFLEIPIYKANNNVFKKDFPIIFTSGTLNNSYMAEPLVDFIRTGFRQIRIIFPNIQFIIVSRKTPKNIANFLINEPGIQFFPWVEDYMQTLKVSDIVIFFDKAGSGIKTRVLQALAGGKAVVGTPIVFEGIKVTNMVNSYIYKSLDEATNAVLLLLRDQNLRLQLGCSARDLVQCYYTQEVIGKQWEKVYRQAIISYATKNSSK